VVARWGSGSDLACVRSRVMCKPHMRYGTKSAFASMGLLATTQNGVIPISKNGVIPIMKSGVLG
jgi:hypothetical protein